ncbi:hypothetical protein XO10_00100 [Marinitoga sp. 1135]|nr:hypothetical protein [Marinitoga sp. 1135]NUU96849.1 hypothetical protein [Marinitoga sp. 1138]
MKVKTAKDFIADAKAVVKEISVEEAFKIYKSKDSKYIFLDVREANEVEAGHIPNAHWIPRGLLEFKIASLVKNTEDKIIVVYCKSGGRSILAAKTLKEMGYNVLSVSGGFTAWKNKRYPIRRGLPGTTGGGCS